ncbi:MAG: hypothetical protein ABJP34_10630 [Erythrobacter sp.]
MIDRFKMAMGVLLLRWGEALSGDQVSIAGQGAGLVEESPQSVTLARAAATTIASAALSDEERIEREQAQKAAAFENYYGWK